MAHSKISEGIKIPEHIAVIMDGNGRWAQSRMMPRMMGHKQGFSRMIELIEYSFKRGVKCVTVYALSTENLKRPKEEIEGLFNLIRTRFGELADRFIKHNSRIRVVGDLSLLPSDVREVLLDAEKRSEHLTEFTLNVALAYGGRAELVRAVNLAVEKGEKVTEEGLSKLLYTDGVPDPDLLIRTGKEKRLSNFLLYQSAYSELYFSDKMFPDFTAKDLDLAIEEYSSRVRRFGKTDEQKTQEKQER
ncbi:MAG: di-trans,poly-cis-decaprenylcistransferase [Clostridia bacterium]|nr:di-trans,poly-cis-decaprenylcistransferase [Clostridia bacterium]